MEREKEKESSYAKAIEQQESVICKLEKLMEESIDSQAKAREYKSQIEGLDKEIAQVKSEVELISEEKDEQSKAYGQSGSVLNEILRLERGNTEYMEQIVQMKKELAEKLKVKREIEDWLDEKVQIEF